MVRHIPVYLEDATIAQLEILAAHKRVPRSTLIRAILEKYVAQVTAKAITNLEGLAPPFTAGEW